MLVRPVNAPVGGDLPICDLPIYDLLVKVSIEHARDEAVSNGSWRQISLSDTIYCRSHQS